MFTMFDYRRSFGLDLPQYRTVYLSDLAPASNMEMPDVLERARQLSRATPATPWRR